MSLRIRRGTEAQRTGFTPDLGEIIWTTNGEKLYVGDGVTPGGKNIGAQLAGVGLTFNGTTGKLDSSASFTTDQISEGVNNKYFSAELAQDAVASALVAGVNSGISFVYNSTQDTGNRIDATVSLTLDNLSDVVISGTPTDGQVLKYNSTNSRWEAGVDVDTDTGILAVVDDTTPKLGGNLDLNSQTINGTGSININGTIAANLGLGANLDLNTRNITGTGNISITGELNVYGSTGTSSITAHTITSGLDTAPGWSQIAVAKGSRANPVNPIAGDFLGGLLISATISGGTKPVCLIAAELTSTSDTGSPTPRSNLYIGVANNSGITRYKFRPDGVFEAMVLKAANYATVDLPATPEKGYMAFDSSTNQFKGWNGTAWVVLG